MVKDRDFIENKKQTLQKLNDAKSQGSVDKDITPILDIINSKDEYYTSSSCYGRIVVLEIPKIGDKKNAVFLGKWHRKISTDEILEPIKKAKKGQIWFLAQSPIIHIYAKTQSAADKILKTAIGCGFKHSGLKSIEKNIVVEITSTERLDSPVGIDGKLLCNSNHLNLLVKIANEIIDKSYVKLDKFENFLRKNL